MDGTAQVNEELDDNVAEWDHGKCPLHPAAGWVILDLTVAEADQQSGGKQWWSMQCRTSC